MAAIKEMMQKAFWETDISDHPAKAFEQGYEKSANDVLDRLKHHLERIDVDNHSDDDLEDLYDTLCEMVKNFKGE